MQRSTRAHVVVRAFGPASVTKRALKRHRRLVRDGRMVVFVENPDVAGTVTRQVTAGDIVVPDPTNGADVAAALGRLEPGMVTLIHDDASVEDDAFDAALEAASLAGRAVALGGSDLAAPCTIGALDVVQELLAHPTASIRTAQSEVRHDHHCGTPPPPQQLLTATLIVRDEEAHLAKCLASLDGVVDDIVVVDTGSTDRTVEIARSCGAAVQEIEWPDDFAAARNVARVAATGTFALWIDADERLDADDVAQLRRQLDAADHTVDAFPVAVSSRRAGAPDSTAHALRIYRPDRLEFEGAVHEQLRRRDRRKLTVGSLTGVSIEHLGYAGSEAELAAKADRNVAIARTQYRADPTAKTAVDLARSIAFAGGDLSEAIDVLDRHESRKPNVMRSLLATKAGLHLDVDDAEAAFETARLALALGWDDVAAATLAVSAWQLGFDDELVTTAGDAAISDSTLEVPANRRTFRAIAAAAAARSGRTDDRDRIVGQLAADPQPALALAHLLDAVGNLPAADAAGCLDASSWNGDIFWPAVDASLGKDVAALVRSAQHTATPAGGITLGFLDESRLPIDRRDLADHVPPDRRVLHWSGDTTLLTRLQATAHDLVDVGDGDVHAWSTTAPSETEPFDVAVGGVSSVDAGAVLDALRNHLDPSGLVVMWETDATGSALPSTSRNDDALVAAATQLGYTVDPAGPQGVLLARAPWDLHREHRVRRPRHELQVHSPTELPEELQLAFRLSLPGDIALDFARDEPSADGAVATLHTDPTIMPDPAWLQALWDAHLANGTPVGARLVTTSGRTVHAGRSESGPRFAGCPSNLPASMVAHRGVTLAPPYISDVGAAPTGTVLGDAVAVTGDEPQNANGPTLTELLPDVVVFLGGPAPGSASDHETKAMDDVFQQLAADSVTPVYRWQPGRAIDQTTLRRWRRIGVVPLAPDVAHQAFADPVRPAADAVVHAFAPQTVVYLSPESLGKDFETSAGRAGRARVIYAGPPIPDELAARCDVVCEPADLATVLGAAQSPVPDRVSAIPQFEPIAQQGGLTSIVIPVFNNWDLTRACLDSIAANTPAPHEIIVVDNGSTDGTARGLTTRQVRAIRNDTNRGFPAAVNQGIAAASGEHIVVLNNDTEVTPGWLEAMHHALAQPDVAMVGPRSNQIAGLQKVPGAPLMADRAAAHEWAETWSAGRPGRTWRTTRLVGFCLLLRRDTFEQVGGFDEAFGIGNYEDDELGDRIMAAGGALAVADDAVVLHHGSATFRTMSIDYAAAMHEAARHHRPNRADVRVPVAAVVLSDGNHAEAAAAASTALRVAERVRITERAGAVATEIAAAAVHGTAVEVRAVDWTSDEGGIAALADLNADRVFVMGSRERIDGDDWGTCRQELESLRGVADVSTAAGAEVRVAPLDHEAPHAVIGTVSGNVLRAVRLV